MSSNLELCLSVCLISGKRRRGRPKKSEQEKKPSTPSVQETDQTSSAAEGLLELSNTG